MDKIGDEITFLLEEGHANWKEYVDAELLRLREKCNTFRGLAGLEARPYAFNTDWNCIEQCPLFRECPYLNFVEDDEEAPLNELYTTRDGFVFHGLR